MTKKVTFLNITLVFILILFLTYPNSVLLAQNNGKIRGVVKDAVNNEVLIGANVFINALRQGASTDADGKFEIVSVPPGVHQLTVSYLGFKEREIEVEVQSNRTLELDIELNPTALELSELVVTGQGGAVEKRKLTSTVSTISSEDIKLAPVENVEELLQGRVPGLLSLTSSGMPGTAGRISTRGIKSVATSSTPVIYVDGVRIDNNSAFRLALDTGGAETSALTDLIVGEIDHVEVIKGGAASTLYGSEAANGVIQIFTKKGMPGKPKWSFRVTSGFDAPEKRYMISDFVKDNSLQTGFYQKYNAIVSGGSDLFTYNISGMMSEDKGVISNNVGAQKIYNISTGFRFNLDETKYLEVSSSYTKNKFGRTRNNNNYNGAITDYEAGQYDDYNGYTESDRLEILDMILQDDIKDDVDRFRIAANFEYNPYKTFKNKFTVGIDYRKNEEREFIKKSLGDFFFVENGGVYRFDREYSTITYSYTGTLELPKLGAIEQTLSFGAQAFRIDDRQSYAQGEHFDIPGTDDFDNAAIIDAQERNQELFNYGFYLSDRIGLWDKVFFDLGLRVDGNSTFGKDIGLQYYPKIGAAYIISDEGYYPGVIKNIISTFKLRAAWGLTGNFPAPFTRDRSYVSQNYLDQVAISFGNPGNDQLKPEKTASIDAGFDLGLFNDNVSIEFNYFYQKTSDALFTVPQDPSTGTNTQLMNVGEIENKGIELALFAQVLNSQDAAIDIRASLATVDNKVTSLGGSAPFTLQGYTFLPQRIEEGYPVGVFRISRPTGDGNSVTELYGNPLPKLSGTFSFSLTLFQRLSLNMLTEFALGQNAVDLKRVLRFFNGDPAYQEILPEDYNYVNASSYWLQDADWIKLREISLTYRVPDDIFRGLTLSASVRNPIVIYSKTENDPEINSAQITNTPAVGGYLFSDISAPKQFRFTVVVDL